MQNDILFDNIYIGHSIEDAEKLAAETFHVKHPIEKELLEAEKPKKDDKINSPSDLKFLDDPVVYVKEKLDLFLTIAQQDPIEAVKFVPEIAGGIAAAIISVLAIIGAIIGSLTSSPAPQKAAGDAKGKAKAGKDKAAEATTTGAEKAKGEATKRTTRSQS